MMLIIFKVLQEVPGQGIAESQFEKIQNPILVLLLLLFIAALVFLYKMYRESKKETRELHDYNKELTEKVIENSSANIEVIKNLEQSFKTDEAAHKEFERLLRENHMFLQTILRESKN